MPPGALQVAISSNVVDEGSSPWPLLMLEDDAEEVGDGGTSFTLDHITVCAYGVMGLNNLGQCEDYMADVGWGGSSSGTKGFTEKHTPCFMGQ